MRKTGLLTGLGYIFAPSVLSRFSDLLEFTTWSH